MKQKSLYTFSDASKILGRAGIKIGRNDLFKKLSELEIIRKDSMGGYRALDAAWCDCFYEEQTETLVQNVMRYRTKLYVTADGINRIANFFLGTAKAEQLSFLEKYEEYKKNDDKEIKCRELKEQLEITEQYQNSSSSPNEDRSSEIDLLKGMIHEQENP